MRSSGNPYWLPLAILLALVAFASCALASDWDIIVRYDDHETCEPGEKAIFYFWVWNSNQSNIDLEATVQFEPPGWTHQFYVYIPDSGSFTSKSSAKFHLDREKRASISLTIYPLATALPGNYSMALRTVLQNGTDSKNKTFTLEMLRVVDANLREDYVPQGGFVGKPGATVRLPISLQNRGNGHDRFLIQVGTEWNSTGWSVSITSGVDDGDWTPSIAPSKFHKFNVSACVPSNSLAEEWVFIDINATSEADPEFIAAFKVRVSTAVVYSVEIELVDENFQEVEGGNASEAVFYIRAINTGNVHDNVSVEPGMAPEFCPNFSLRVEPLWSVLPPGASIIFEATVDVPPGALKKEYTFWVFVTPEMAEPEKITFYVKVSQFFAVELYSLDPRKTTDPGGVLDYEVRVKNMGNGLDFFGITLIDVPTGWLTYVQPIEVTLLTSEEAIVNVRVVVPQRFEEAPMGQHIIKVMASSRRFEVATAQTDLIVVINQFFLVEWTYRGSQITHPEAPRAQAGIIKPDQGLNPYGYSTWQAGFYGELPTIRNYGNSEVNVSAQMSTDEPRFEIEFEPTEAHLPWKGSTPVNVSITAPVGIPPGEYLVELILICDDDPKFEPRVLPIKVTVYTLDLAIGQINVTGDGVSVVEGHVNVTELSYVNIKYWIENQGTGPVERATVRISHISPRGERNELDTNNVSIAPGKSVRHSYRWYAHERGDHLFEIRIELDNQSRTDNDVGVLEVTVVELPKVPIDEHGVLEDWRTYITGLLLIALLIVLYAMLRGRRASIAESREGGLPKDEPSEGVNVPESGEEKQRQIPR